MPAPGGRKNKGGRRKGGSNRAGHWASEEHQSAAVASGHAAAALVDCAALAACVAGHVGRSLLVLQPPLQPPPSPNAGKSLHTPSLRARCTPSLPRHSLDEAGAMPLCGRVRSTAIPPTKPIAPYLCLSPVQIGQRSRGCWRADERAKQEVQLGKMANGGHKRKQPSSGRQPEAEPELYVQVAALGYDGRPVFVFPDLGDNDSLFKIGSGVADGGSGVVDMSSKIDQTKDMEWYYEANRRHCAVVRRVCATCNGHFDRSRYSKSQWRKSGGLARCSSCVEFEKCCSGSLGK